MELSVYGVEKLAAMRLDELRADGRRVALLEAVRRPRSRIVSGLGAALMRVGRWLALGKPIVGGKAGVRLAR